MLNLIYNIKFLITWVMFKLMLFTIKKQNKLDPEFLYVLQYTKLVYFTKKNFEEIFNTATHDSHSDFAEYLVNCFQSIRGDELVIIPCKMFIITCSFKAILGCITHELGHIYTGICRNEGGITLSKFEQEFEADRNAMKILESLNLDGYAIMRDSMLEMARKRADYEWYVKDTENHPSARSMIEKLDDYTKHV